MGNLLSTTVLGALLMFSPTTARQTASFGVKIQPQDIQILREYAQNSSNATQFIEMSENIAPVVAKQPQTASVTYSKPVQKAIVVTTQTVAAATELEALVEKYATTYGANKDIMMVIMNCESGSNPMAINGSFGGLFQFMSSTWVSNRKAMGLETDPQLRFNAEEAIRTAAFKMGRDGYGAWPACSSKAFSKLAIN